MTEEEAGVGLAGAGTAEAAIAVAEALPALADMIKNKAAPKILVEGAPLAGIHPTLLTAFCTLVLLYIPQVMSYGPETAQFWKSVCKKAPAASTVAQHQWHSLWSDVLHSLAEGWMCSLAVQCGRQRRRKGRPRWLPAPTPKRSRGCK